MATLMDWVPVTVPTGGVRLHIWDGAV